MKDRLLIAACTLATALLSSSCDATEPTADTDASPDVALEADATPDVASETDTAPQSDTPTDPDTSTDPDPDAPLSAHYPGDQGIADDPAVLFFDDFETGWGRWDAPQNDIRYLTWESDAAAANAGEGYLRSTVTFADLQEQQYISAAPRAAFDRRVDTMYWRFYARFPHVAPNPHHWIRVAAGDASFQSSGLANTLPEGDRGFWFDFDISNADVFNFYVYWHAMRSGRCNDGSVTPGCPGDQGTTYYYGNVFEPAEQTPFERDE